MYSGGDRLGLPAQPGLQATPGGALRLQVPRLRRQQQPVEVLRRELGIQRQQWALPALARHHQRELHYISAVFPQPWVHHVGARGQHVVQQRAQVHLPPAAAGFDVGEDAPEVSDLRRHRLHVGDGPLHLRELVHHALEAAVDASLHRALQPLADAALNFGQPQRRLLPHFAQLSLQQRPGVAAVPGQGGGERPQRRLQLQPRLLGPGAQRAFRIGQSGAGGVRLRPLPGGGLLRQQQQPLRGLHAWRAPQEQQGHEHAEQEQQGTRQEQQRIGSHTGSLRRVWAGCLVIPQQLALPGQRHVCK